MVYDEVQQLPYVGEDLLDPLRCGHAHGAAATHARAGRGDRRRRRVLGHVGPLGQQDAHAQGQAALLRLGGLPHQGVHARGARRLPVARTRSARTHRRLEGTCRAPTGDDRLRPGRLRRHRRWHLRAALSHGGHGAVHDVDADRARVRRQAGGRHHRHLHRIGRPLPRRGRRVSSTSSPSGTTWPPSRAG